MRHRRRQLDYANSGRIFYNDLVNVDAILERRSIRTHFDTTALYIIYASFNLVFLVLARSRRSMVRRLHDVYAFFVSV